MIGEPMEVSMVERQRRYDLGTGPVRGWQAAIVIAPLYIGVIALLTLALVLSATSGHWGLFWMFVVVEVCALGTILSSVRARGAKD
jgi:hypothetical protein